MRKIYTEIPVKILACVDICELNFVAELCVEVTTTAQLVELKLGGLELSQITGHAEFKDKIRIVFIRMSINQQLEIQNLYNCIFIRNSIIVREGSW